MAAPVSHRKRALEVEPQELAEKVVSKDKKGKVSNQQAAAVVGRNVLSHEKLQSWMQAFDANPQNILARNAVLMAGGIIPATNPDAVAKVNHLFLITVKGEHVKATNQAASGRCWMFAGLNMLRHHFMNALDIKNFEFSETYLYFYDKVERANAFLEYIDTHLDTPSTELVMHQHLSDPISDGGYFSMFANLVSKYGLCPKEAMPETACSGYSAEMNDMIATRLREAAFLMRSKKMTAEQRLTLRQEVVQNIHDIAVKFLGKPPQKFDWNYMAEGYEPKHVSDLTPAKFSELVLGGTDINDYVTLTNFPDKLMNQKYEIKLSANVSEGKNQVLINLPIADLRYYVIEQLTMGGFDENRKVYNGLPIWFGADVSKGFHPFYSALNDELTDYNLLFGKSPYTLSKSESLQVRETACNHAMTITGVNLNQNGKPIEWQVENSWGYSDHEEPGEDGFLTMSDKWFEDHVFEVVIHKSFLKGRIAAVLNMEPIMLDPTDSLAIAAKIN